MRANAAAKGRPKGGKNYFAGWLLALPAQRGKTACMDCGHGPHMTAFKHS